MTKIIPEKCSAGLRENTFVFAPVRNRNRAKTHELASRDASAILVDMQRLEQNSILITDEAALLSWLQTAQPGDRVLYHIGHLGSDRLPEFSSLPEAARRALDRLADRVMALVADDALTVAQRRQPDGRMDYLAIKTSPPTASRTPERRIA